MSLVYVLYILSGIIKTVFIFYGISFPVDITVLTASILIIHIIVDFMMNGISLKYNRNILYSLLLLLSFYLWIVVSLSYTQSPYYSYIKTFLFFTNIIAFAYPLLITNFFTLRFIRQFIISIVIFFIWFYYVYFILIGKLRGSDLYYQIMGLSLTLGIFGGISLLILLTSKEKIFNNFVLNKGLILLISVLLIISGARGPIFFVVLSYFLFLIYKLFYLKFNKTVNLKKTFKILFIGIPVILSSAAVFFYKFLDKAAVLAERSFYRMSLILDNVDTSSKMGVSVDTRLEQYKFAVEYIFKSLKNVFIGSGFGSFGIIYSGTDGRLYPHNIFLEIWFELGIAGLLLFIAFLTVAFFYKSPKRIYLTGFVILYMVLNMLKSSSIVDIRVFFAFFALFIISDNFKKYKNIQN